MSTEGLRQCPVCKELKPRTSDFFYRDRKSPSGLQYYCKECRSESASKYAKDNREKTSKRKMDWAKNNPDRVESNRLSKLYGITTETYREILESQDFACAICAYVPSSGDKALHVDHNHKTGNVRGLLCHRCNSALGFLRDSEEVCLSTLKYLRRHR